MRYALNAAQTGSRNTDIHAASVAKTYVIWTAVVEERYCLRWWMYEVGGRDLSAFLRLLDRLPGADMYATDAYQVYEWLPRARHAIGKGGAVNRMRGRSKLRSKLNRLARSAKGYTKSVKMLKHLLAIALAECLNQSLISTSAAQ